MKEIFPHNFFPHRKKKKNFQCDFQRDDSSDWRELQVMKWKETVSTEFNKFHIIVILQNNEIEKAYLYTQITVEN